MLKDVNFKNGWGKTTKLELLNNNRVLSIAHYLNNLLKKTSKDNIYLLQNIKIFNKCC